MARLHGREEDQCRYPDKYYVKPFRIAGNIWYIGNKSVCSHLIDTGDGLVIIDTSFPEFDYQIFNSIWEAGFNPKDVKIVLHTHLHYDHFGATVSLQKIYGAKAYIGKREWENAQEHPEQAMVPDTPYAQYRLFKPDVLLKDGDEVCLGNTTIRCVETPGHTYGTMSFLFDVEDNGSTYTAGTFGGAGFITLYQEHFARYAMENLQQTFLNSIHRLREEKVDIVLGNHPAPNHILEKRAIQLSNPAGQNPFIDSQDWIDYLDWVEDEFVRFQKDGN
jgi:metallo-beta-lactamase class B